MSKSQKTPASPDVKALQLQVEALTDALQRERADAMNLRRRMEEEKAKMANIHKTIVIRDLLPVIDNLERALKHVPAELADHDYVRGIRSIVKQFEKALEDLGIERIETVGKHFNPKFHEAAALEEGGEGTKEVVSEELQAGYKLGDEVIRHATVKVKMEK